MDGDGDGNRSERSRVRENMEGDRALQRQGSKYVRKTKDKKKKKKNEGIVLRPAQKKGSYGYMYYTQPKTSPKKTQKNE